ncbi:MAG: tetratricopeptide repeat protein [Ferruginibacter sp.]
MKSILTFLTIFIGLNSSAQDSTLNLYEKKVELILNKIDSKEIIHDDKKDLKAIAFDLQNKGQISDESAHNYTSSLSLISKAIKIFTYLDDTLSIANNLKFRGYLLGRFGKFDEAKTEIKRAISLFRSKNKDWGIAVSNFDLSRVYDLEKKSDSAIYYCNLSLNYWKSKKDTSRIFNNQNLLIYLLTKAGQVSRARTIQEDSQILAKVPELHWQDLIDFYFFSAGLYKKTNRPGIYKTYQELYTTKIVLLNNEGNAAKSYYDIRP